MKKIIYLFLLCSFSIHSFAKSEEKKVEEKKSDEKKGTYTEEQFYEKLKQEVAKIKKTSVVEMTQDLIGREQKVVQREEELLRREEEIKNVGAELEKKIVEFDARQKQFLGCVQKNENDEKLRVKKMVEVVSNMSPAKAAQLIETQESDISVRILSQLDNLKAAKIFNVMNKEKSAQLQKQYLLMKQ